MIIRHCRELLAELSGLEERIKVLEAVVEKLEPRIDSEAILTQVLEGHLKNLKSKL